MTNEIYPSPACECGGQLDEGQNRCTKCLARDRWIKKQAARNRKRRGETRRPPRGPRNGGKAGVVWS